MYEIDTTNVKNIRMPAETTLSFNMLVTGEDSEAFDGVEFTCKEMYSDVNIFKKTLGDGITVQSETGASGTSYLYTIRVLPEDTEKAEVGKYFYDLRCSINADTLCLMEGELVLVR